MFSQVFVYNQTGIPLIRKTYKYDMPGRLSFMLANQLGRHEPIFQLDEDIYVVSIPVGELYLVGCTRESPPLALAIDTLERLGKLIGDVCGSPEESRVREHILLVYEVLDEALIAGYPVLLDMESLERMLTCSHIANTPRPGLLKRLTHLLEDHRTTEAQSAMRSVLPNPSTKTEEVYLDVLEQVNCTFNEDGDLVEAMIDGHFKLRCFLSGQPLVQLKLVPTLSITESTVNLVNDQHLVLSNCRFHESVDQSAFTEQQILLLPAPKGELNIFSYHLLDEFIAPFQLMPMLEIQPATPRQLSIELRLRADFSSDFYASKCTVFIPLPSHVVSATANMDSISEANRNVTFDRERSRFIWYLVKVQGCTERTLHLQATLESDWQDTWHNELKAIRLEFEITNYTCSTLSVHRLRILNQACDQPPNRWIRYITTSGTYLRRW